ncbi:MAG: OmpA family protein [Flavobacteriaceae bacterium]
MSKTTGIIGLLIVALLGIFLYNKLCSSCMVSEPEPVKETVTAPVAPDPTSYPLAFRDGEFGCDVNDNFNFKVSSSAILEPMSQNVVGCLGRLKSFLADNEGKVINITGYYESDETNDTAFPNLGLARANAVKNYLVNQGISSASINTYGKLMDEMVPDGDIYRGPIAYELAGESVDAADELKALYEKIKANPLVLHFNTAEASISLTPEQRQKFADISRYLDKVEGSSCNVVGHTDNTGNRNTNIRLGQERADFAKGYLMRNGISEGKINASSKGPDQPVATNDTEEGRAQNRRTVITLN